MNSKDLNSPRQECSNSGLKIVLALLIRSGIDVSCVYTYWSRNPVVLIPHWICTLTERRHASSGHAPGHKHGSLAIIWVGLVSGKMWVLARKQGHGNKDRTFPGHVQTGATKQSAKNCCENIILTHPDGCPLKPLAGCNVDNYCLNRNDV